MTGTLSWFKSSYSNDSGGQCLEAAHDWLRSSYSGSSGGDCLEAVAGPRLVHVRDSKAPDGAVLTVSASAWAAFLAGPATRA
ncbi:DUF397 domain-containing protein [Streptomyces sp. NPDC090306]|uniref:DUF397 domain-containing protein n=1 Tax=Streptomyces sp. NPDC090306 TaxID=3365961 RepID=UPI0037F227C2